MERRERYYIETMECINMTIPTRTGKERDEVNRERNAENHRAWCEANKERRAEQQRAWGKANREAKREERRVA
jgi:hypothetical protein